MGPFSEALRFVPKLQVTGENVKFLSAMNALVRAPAGTHHTLHRTYLQTGQHAEISSPRRLRTGGITIDSYVALSAHAKIMAFAHGLQPHMIRKGSGRESWI